MQIIIPEDYQGAVKNLNCLRLLQDHDVIIYQNHFKSVDEAAEKLKEADVIVLIRERTEITDSLLTRLPRLKLLSQTGKISNHLDLAACTRHGVAVAEGVGSPISPAELTWALILNGYRKIPQAIDSMKKGLWQTNTGNTLHDSTLGIWGYGKIGKMIASYAKVFGMKVIIWGSESSRMNAVADGHIVADSKKDFFSSADIVTLHLRLVNETKAIVRREDLMLMKPTALLVNTSRAELIEDGALMAALQSGNPGGAALDVYEQEPVYDEHFPLLQMPNVICTPHLGYVSEKGFELYFSKAFENILAFASGNPVNIANPEVLTQ